MEERRPDRRRDHERRAAVDVALALAEDSARDRDYDHALAYLDAVEDLIGGTLGPRLSLKQAIWTDALAARGGTRMPAPSFDEVPLA
jgi:hypothetical protein